MSEENTEFAALFEASGWNQREAAERLYTTTATISRYLSGSIAVPKSAVELFKLVLVGENPAALKPAGKTYPAYRSEFGVLRDQLEEIKDADPARFRAAKLVIDSLHREVTANSAEAAALAEGTAALDAAGVPRPPAARERKPATPAPTAHTARPAAPARPRSSARPAPPKPAPTAPGS